MLNKGDHQGMKNSKFLRCKKLFNTKLILFNRYLKFNRRSMYLVPLSREHRTQCLKISFLKEGECNSREIWQLFLAVEYRVEVPVIIYTAVFVSALAPNLKIKKIKYQCFCFCLKQLWHISSFIINVLKRRRDDRMVSASDGNTWQYFVFPAH